MIILRRIWKTPYPYIPVIIIIILVFITRWAFGYINQTVNLAIVKAVENTAKTTALTKLPESKDPIVKKYKPSSYQQNAVRKYAESIWTHELTQQLRNAPIRNLNIDKFQITFPSPSTITIVESDSYTITGIWSLLVGSLGRPSSPSYLFVSIYHSKGEQYEYIDQLGDIIPDPKEVYGVS